MTQLIINNSKLSSGNAFFAPVDTSKIELLFSQYKMQRNKIESMHDVISGEDNSHTLDYFTNSKWDKFHSNKFDPRRVFDLDCAIAYLNATFWKMALALTDVYDHMPSKSRDEWNDMIREHTTLDFDDDTVISTLQVLLNSRDEYLSRRVQDIFEGLSGEHVTNSPQAFNKKMIFQMYDKQTGLINDLRDVISKMSGRGTISWCSTSTVVDGIYSTGNTGKWLELDGGAIRIRVYLKGTAHIEVHPDICWRLNEILAINNPRAIPAEFRRKPEKKHKAFDYSQSLLPFNVLAELSNVKQAYNHLDRYNHKKIIHCFSTWNSSADKHTTQQVQDVMIACGGVRTSKGGHSFQFDYNFLELIPEIIRTGSIPEKRSHQFYPTEQELAERAASLLDFKDSDLCLEPSAGQGGLLDFMPADTIAVEISALQCELLKLKGYKAVINSDFIEFAKLSTQRFDKILMNPPFSQGRHEQHLYAAMNLLNEKGKLVTILPDSARNKPEKGGFKYEWSDTIYKAFKGVSIDVVILTVTVM